MVLSVCLHFAISTLLAVHAATVLAVADFADSVGIGLLDAVDGDRRMRHAADGREALEDPRPFDAYIHVSRDIRAGGSRACHIVAEIDEDFVLAGVALAGIVPALFEVHGLLIVGPGHLPVGDAGAALDRADGSAVLEPPVDDFVAGKGRRRNQQQSAQSSNDDREELVHGRSLSWCQVELPYTIAHKHFFVKPFAVLILSRI